MSIKREKENWKKLNADATFTIFVFMYQDLMNFATVILKDLMLITKHH